MRIMWTTFAPFFGGRIDMGLDDVQLTATDAPSHGRGSHGQRPETTNPLTGPCQHEISSSLITLYLINPILLADAILMITGAVFKGYEYKVRSRGGKTRDE